MGYNTKVSVVSFLRMSIGWPCERNLSEKVNVVCCVWVFIVGIQLPGHDRSDWHVL